MSKVKLSEVVSYSNQRITFNDLDMETYISTDNLLPNKNGLAKANQLPAIVSSVLRYDVDDILVSNIRPYLKKIYFSKQNGGVSADVLIFRVKNGAIPKFVYYALFQDAFFVHMMAGSKGTKMPRGDKSQILEFEVPKFPIEDQQKIAAVLSSLDDKIELNNRINAELEQLAKTLYDYWFVQFEFPISKEQAAAMGQPELEGKPYKTSGGKMVWNEQLKREIPEGWGDNALSTLIEIFDSKRIPLSSQERAVRKGIYPYYGATGILDHVNDYLFNDDYILVAEDGSIMDELGFPIVQFITGKTWVNNHAHVIQAKVKELNEFVFQTVKRIPVVLIKTGSIQMKINQENLKKYRVLIPLKNQMMEYSKFSEEIRFKILNNQKQNQHLSSLRDWLLPMLMNGQVRVE